MDLRHYRPAGVGVTELAPEACPAGHPLGPGTVLIGCMPCLCAGQSHRIWMCVACREVLTWPPCQDHPEWVTWEGISRETDIEDSDAARGRTAESTRRAAEDQTWDQQPGNWFD